MKLTIDFETRSKISLFKVGAWMYSRHPSTNVLVMSWSDGALDHGRWKMGDAAPEALFKLVAAASAIEAHYSFFERCIWTNVCAARYGWPAIPEEKWRCSASKAAAAALPRALGDAGRALNLDTVKDEKDGKWAMQKLSRPRRPTKNDPREWNDDPADWDKMMAYNENDVFSEEALSAALPDLTPIELEVWRLTERMNMRGIPVDVAGCAAAVRMAGERAAELTMEFNELTGLDTAGQRAKFLVWLAGRGHELKNTQAGTLKEFIETATDAAAARAAGIMMELGMSSIKKYRAILDMADSDGRCRGCFAYHGAHTGRHAGGGIQPQNFKREGPSDADGAPLMDQAWKYIHRGDLDEIEAMYGDPMELLSKATRGAIMASSGKIFRVGDYAQIEARKIFWLSGETKALDTFRRGEDAYVEMATTIFGGVWRCDVGHASRAKGCSSCDLMRFLGKQTVLALGFGAGFVKFLVHCRNLGAPPFAWRQVCELTPAGWRNATLRWILNEGWDGVRRLIPNATVDDAKELVLTKWIVDQYRASKKNTVVAYWKKLEDAAKNATRRPNQTFRVGALSFTRGKRFLNCKLPSGRIMRYLDSRISESDDLCYTANEGNVRKMYGGMIAENITQASSRDIMTEAMLRLDAHPNYRDTLVMTIHDEVVSECDPNVGSLDEFMAILAEPPRWCADLPIKVEGFESVRYRK